MTNPAHAQSAPQTRWTTVNFAEAIQGTQTPLSFDVWGRCIELAMRGCFIAFGVRGVDPTVPEDANERYTVAFYGRAAANLTTILDVVDRLPGTSGAILEEKLFGTPAGPAQHKPLSLYAGYPRILAKMPRAAWRAPGEIARLLEDYRAWWRDAVLDRPPADLAGAQRLFADATERFRVVATHHTAVSFMGPQLVETLASLGEKATGDPHLGLDLCTGYGGMEETQIIEDLWSASRGRLTVADIQRRHGFHGPSEGQLETASWREDPRHVEAILSGYAAKSALASPREREREQIARRDAAERRTLAGLHAWERPGARAAMKIASVVIPARELGKAAFLHTVDAARSAARVAGRELAAAGVIEDPGDVFFLTAAEFAAVPAGIRERIAERRAAHVQFAGVTVPPAFTGQPEAVTVATGPSGDAVSSLQGIGVVGDVVTGRARVVDDPAMVELDDGDILVCATTDPSWTPLFMLVDAMVIDTGGQLSHGAIVARELGVTCVINTVTGTRDIPDGALITVDGARGTVEIHPETP